VLESGHTETSGALGYSSSELREIFSDFRILELEDTVEIYEWSGKPRRLIRFVGQKPPA
jgi:hypothetical protein